MAMNLEATWLIPSMAMILVVAALDANSVTAVHEKLALTTNNPNALASQAGLYVVITSPCTKYYFFNFPQQVNIITLFPLNLLQDPNPINVRTP